ncbi:hypothetical protein LOAG_10490 [Loa loa]|uniref:Uncharacterized protein n=1 Tax=Loa loa TaxID=7209 RepID=A0A1S0TR09_LOALO|nr:hypothetical protein LOAG_10490 [Loa loa]EFO18007.1 hypothetical protein LOAG_10490 [Loa loa]
MSHGKDSMVMQSLTDSKIDIENSEILDDMETLEENNSSISHHPCGSDPVYQAYFTHMNAGRLKVCYRLHAEICICYKQSFILTLCA